MRVVVHGGAGNPNSNRDGCETAARSAFAFLASGETSLQAAIAAVVSMEDDGRFNAGSGSALRLDGTTVEMDASVMDTRGTLGAVACLQLTKNPVRVAEAVSKTIHWLLAGEGATRFARTAGFPEYPVKCARARGEHLKLLEALRGDRAKRDSLERHWNYPQTRNTALNGCDTVGAVALDKEGHFAVASSTGGSMPSLLGRVGDTPIVGCGFYAGPLAAVAATGIGEQIVRRLLARTVYGWIETGMPLQQALDRGVALFPDDVAVGLIAASRDASATASNRSMPVCVIER